jgi:hypothetical protein
VNDNHQINDFGNYQILEAYIQICNKALAYNKHKFPFNKIWEAISQKCQNQDINIALVDDYPTPVCRLSFSNKGVELSETNSHDNSKRCHIKLSHIKNVLKNQEEYIQDPTKIDWHWIEMMIDNHKSSQG